MGRLVPVEQGEDQVREGQSQQWTAEVRWDDGPRSESGEEPR